MLGTEMNPIVRPETAPTILLVESDEMLARMFLRFFRANCGFHIVWEQESASTLERVVDVKPDLVILDIGCYLEDEELRLIRDLRLAYERPIFVIASLIRDGEEIAALDAGADGCFGKPININLLSARIRAMYRRWISELGRTKRDLPFIRSRAFADDGRASAIIRIGELTIDTHDRRAYLGEKDLCLTAGEFSLLMVLAEHVGEPVDRDALYETLFGRSWDGLDRAVDQRVKRLRSKIGDNAMEPRWIKSVRGTGYLMVSTTA